MLKLDTWEPDVPLAGEVGGVSTVHGHYFAHAGHSASSFAHLLARHSFDHRMAQRTTAWAHDLRGTWDQPAAGDAYAVLGWTTTAALRTALSRRLDTLHPVAAFRLLEQPEIAALARSTHDFVILRGSHGLGNDWPPEIAGAISGIDLDLWPETGTTDADGAVALDLDTYLHRFVGTEFAG
ncbi:MAG: hypothetical protein LCH96_15905 [Actinobacteria bacterium]|nr:hypothetical protein [Actinomycetota bacterium]